MSLKRETTIEYYLMWVFVGLFILYLEISSFLFDGIELLLETDNLNNENPKSWDCGSKVNWNLCDFCTSPHITGSWDVPFSSLVHFSPLHINFAFVFCIKLKLMTDFPLCYLRALLINAPLPSLLFWRTSKINQYDKRCSKTNYLKIREVKWKKMEALCSDFLFYAWSKVTLTTQLDFKVTFPRAAFIQQTEIIETFLPTGEKVTSFSVFIIFHIYLCVILWCMLCLSSRKSGVSKNLQGSYKNHASKPSWQYSPTVWEFPLYFMLHMYSLK